MPTTWANSIRPCVHCPFHWMLPTLLTEKSRRPSSVAPRGCLCVQEHKKVFKSKTHRICITPLAILTTLNDYTAYYSFHLILPGRAFKRFLTNITFNIKIKFISFVIYLFLIQVDEVWNKVNHYILFYHYVLLVYYQCNLCMYLIPALNFSVRSKCYLEIKLGYFWCSAVQ